MAEWSNATTTAASSSFEAPTVANVLRCMADFERRFPRSERAVSVALPPSSEELLLRACGQMFPAKDDRAYPRSLLGLRIEHSLEVPYQGYEVRMADGSKVIHYADGRVVRCLASTPPH